MVSDAEGEVLLQPATVEALQGRLSLGPVSLREVLNLEVVETAVVPFAGRSDLQGVITDYPPLPDAGIADSLAEWKDRSALSGRVLDPRDGRQAVLVAVRLSDPTSLGHLTGSTLEVDDGTGPTTRSYDQALLVKPPGTTCRVDDPDEIAAW